MPHPPMTPSAAGYLVPYPPYPYGAPYWHPPPPVVEYITTIEPEDVLSGRGGATNSHSGNRAFRVLVKQHQDEYLKAKKRDKPAVASKIVEMIRKKGGRFLRRWDTSAEGQVLWVDIGDERAREKTCQALREGAPELRRRKKDLSSDEGDSKPSPVAHKSATTTTSSSSDNLASPSTPGKDRVLFSNSQDGCFKTVCKEEDAHAPEEAGSGEIVIRPLVQLLQDRSIDPIPLDQLSSDDRDLYLRDFWPPCPPIRKRAFARCGSDSVATEVDSLTSRANSPHIHV